jgi:predicted Fe-S protein YdhL (DUF1289 family)
VTVPAEEASVASPCNSVCSIDGVTGYCAGCFRTLVEIASWSDLSPAEKRALISMLERRRSACGSAVASRVAVDAQR